MVYRGKPSKGCGECRARKIRCDQQRPVCSQCVKTNRVCSGYRDELSLMFRDESQDVARKAKAGPTGRKSAKDARKSRTASPSGDSAQSDPELCLEKMIDYSHLLVNDSYNYEANNNIPTILQLQRRSQLVSQPYPALERDEAICFFFRSNAWPGTIWMLDSTFSSSNTLPSQKAMMAGITSVGMALLSRARNSKAMKEAATKEYGSALKLIKAALEDKVDVKSNSTLATVILFSIFEVVVNRAPQDIDNWTNHILGATALLEMRGIEQLQTDVGLRMFLQLRYHIIISCLQRSTYIPPTLLECTKFAMFLRPGVEAYSDHLVNIIARLTNLRADLTNKGIADESVMLNAACLLDNELITWLAGVPPVFAYEDVEYSTPNPSLERRCHGIKPYGAHYHVYQDLWITNAWNQYRCARILASDIIISCLKRMASKSPDLTSSSEYRERCRSIRGVIRQLAADICATVPFHLGFAETSEADAGFKPTSETYVGGIIILWPLFMAGVIEIPGHPLFEWVVNCFRVIGHSMGIDQALALMDLIKNGETLLEEKSSYFSDEAVELNGENDSSQVDGFSHAIDWEALDTLC